MSALKSLFAVCATACFIAPNSYANEPLVEQARSALRKAVTYFRTKVATEGSYLWRYSEDLSKREGEGNATATQAWVQPPGTPAVGLAFLEAYRATGDKFYLDAARETAHALVKGQLRSGGWDYRIEFEPKLRRKYAYRADGDNAGTNNTSTLDDNTTQSALRFLMLVDESLARKDAAIHDAAQYGLSHLLDVQYPNGAWPQRYEKPADPLKFPVKKASYPESWPRSFPGKDYRAYYTFNDNSIADAIDVLFEAERIYGEDKYRRAAEKAGDFMILAQMPDPQPGWAQQYDLDMHPAWARKFEPPAITGGESQRVMRTLLKLYRETRNKKYLEPLPKALDYYRRSLLPDGRLARFYELKSNKPLYFTKKYELTYQDDDLPTHYAFKVGNGLDAIAREYDRLKNLDPVQLKQPAPAKPQLTPALVAQAKKVIAALDEQGRWVENGSLRSQGAQDDTRRIIACDTFIRNVKTLSGFLRAAKQ
ncbi:MAG: hypothetical protein L0Y72_08160 [Gemmataceae bacterium]|nr:hypothetical protein [Gemmataceae bacterium]MCI0739002.1 hypothetical protein [Gemmataceae bacterium]